VFPPELSDTFIVSVSHQPLVTSSSRAAAGVMDSDHAYVAMPRMVLSNLGHVPLTHWIGIIAPHATAEIELPQRSCARVAAS
jgi:hypothetical protein